MWSFFVHIIVGFHVRRPTSNLIIDHAFLPVKRVDDKGKINEVLCFCQLAYEPKSMSIYLDHCFLWEYSLFVSLWLKILSPHGRNHCKEHLLGLQHDEDKRTRLVFIYWTINSAYFARDLSWSLNVFLFNMMRTSVACVICLRNS